MTIPTNRRKFISKALLTGGALTLGGTFFNLSQTIATETDSRPNLNLIKDPKGICDLPKDFKYTIISQYDETMTDGNKVPNYHDGMGCFPGPNGEIILVRNHEVSLYLFSDPESPEPNYAYDTKSSGGTTTIWLGENLQVIKHYLSLTGTIRNCGGGKTPWGTWISSEEVEEGFGGGWNLGKPHGYNFEIDPLKPIQKAQPLKAMGRFRHEAVGVDPQTGIAYQTQDDMQGCFYRFIPNKKQHFEQGGQLQALKLVDINKWHTSKHPLKANKKYDCVWVDIDDPDPQENNIHKQAQEKGAAIFVRGEGIAVHKDGIYFACTAGGAQGIGQFFKYVANDDNEKGTIELVFEAKKNGILEKPDNITINQWGDLIICEDNSLDTQCLMGLTPEGKIYYIAANTQSEWAGACFSPDGKTLFANIYKGPGMTLAIRGPWKKLRS